MKIRYVAPVILVALLGCKEKESSPAKPEAPKAAASALVAKAAEPAVAPAGTFEGEIEFSIEMKNKAQLPSKMLALFKGNRMRFDAPAEAMGKATAGGSAGLGSTGLTASTASKAYQLISIDEGKMLTVVEAQKMAMQMDIAKFAEQMKGMTGQAAAPTNTPPPKVTKTGKTDTVVDRSCEEWEIVNANAEKLTLCVAKGGGWPSLPAALMPAGEAWSKDVFDGAHFPLRIVLNGADGAEKMRMQVTRMDKKPLADALFSVPEGYRVMDMASMMGGMGAMGGAGGGSGVMTAPITSVSGRPQIKLPPNVEKMIQEAKAKAAAKKAK